ncbi:MAG: Nre family DNA repair protein [Thermoplasmata archaeon]
MDDYIRSVVPTDSLFELSASKPTNYNMRCVICKGSRMLCGKASCPILMKFYVKSKTFKLLDSNQIYGSTPPGAFIGRMGYPYVYVGPLVPPITGDTTVLDTPEMWTNRTMEEIVDFRFKLVRGKHYVKVTDIEKNKIVLLTRELALADAPTGIEAKFTKKPGGDIVLDDDVQPFGPSAPLEKIDVENYKIDRRIEKAYYDTDMKAKDAVLETYRAGVLVSKIQRAFSVGAFGQGKLRKFVPTRWSITAVDSILGLELLKKTKTFPQIGEYLIFEHKQLDNIWEILMTPTEWCYELIEAWYPKTVWNPTGNTIAIFSSAEFFEGRKEYAEIGGCYYAARLAVNEKLHEMQRQAGVVIMREAHPGYIMPVGVWNVREAVRAALKNPPKKFNTLQEALDYAGSKLAIPMKRWIKESAVLKYLLLQKRLDEYVDTKRD